MSKMSYIAYLCKEDDKETLIDELNMSGLTKLTGKTVEEVADGFIAAYNNIRLQKNNPAFKKLNEIQDEMLEFEQNKGEKNENN